MQNKIDEQDCWEIFDCFWKNYGPNNHQISSYNDFVDLTRNFVNSRPPLVIGKNYFIVGNCMFEKPFLKENDGTTTILHPNTAIRRDCAYLSKCTFDVTIKIKKENGDFYDRHHKSVCFGYIPVMKDSILCNNHSIKGDSERLAAVGEDIMCPGGFFITKGGATKVVNCQQQSAANEIFVYPKKNKPKLNPSSEVRNVTSEHKSSTTIVGINTNGIIVTNIPKFKDYFPVGVLFAAFGAKSTQEIVSCVNANGLDKKERELLSRTLESHYSIFLTEDPQIAALEYIGQRRSKVRSAVDHIKDDAPADELIAHTRQVLETDVFPNITNSCVKELYLKKLLFLGLMVKRLLQVTTKKRNPEDRDHYCNKVISTLRNSFTSIFHSAYQKFERKIVEVASGKQETTNIISLIYPQIISNAMMNALTADIWTGKDKTPGISQQYEKFNYQCSLANTRKFIITLANSEKVEGPKLLHNSHHGVVCPYETPEGKKCGLINNLSMSGLVASGCDPADIIKIIMSMGKKFIKPLKKKNYGVCIFVNGIQYAYTKNPVEFVNAFRLLRRSGGISYEISVVYLEKQGDIIIRTDQGRYLRPLFIVESGELVATKEHIKRIKDGEGWMFLIMEGIIEFIDKIEESEMKIAWYPDEINQKHTHCEIHPSLMMGIGASLIPFSNHNQSPRNAYQASMGKQAIGVPCVNWVYQTKGKMYALNYPQKQMCPTEIEKIIGHQEMPSGQNVTVFVGPMLGYGQEDGIILNLDSCQRGLFSITMLFSFSARCKSEKKEEFINPRKDDCPNFKGNPSKLDPKTHHVNIGQAVEKGDTLIGMRSPIEGTSQFNDMSVLYDHTIPGMVHNIETGYDGEGYPYIRVIVAQFRMPDYGDKFSAKHSQKGTCCKLLPGIDMPRTQFGIVPDVVINSLAFPSRMTVGMEMEMLLGKKVASGHLLNQIYYKKQSPDDIDTEYPFESYEYPDGKSDCSSTPFRKDWSCSDVGDILRKMGYDGFGDEVVYNGQTGEELPGLMFVGMCQYQRLRHMTCDKFHARDKGSRTRLTRQPKEGRKHKGGFRIGVMERDNIASQGSSAFLVDRMVKQSDPTIIYVCRNCGLPAIHIFSDVGGKMQYCKVCSGTNIASVMLPYAAKLLAQELSVIGVCMRIMTEQHSVKEIDDVYYDKNGTIIKL